MHALRSDQAPCYYRYLLTTDKPGAVALGLTDQEYLALLDGTPLLALEAQPAQDVGDVPSRGFVRGGRLEHAQPQQQGGGLPLLPEIPAMLVPSGHAGDYDGNTRKGTQRAASPESTGGRGSELARSSRDTPSGGDTPQGTPNAVAPRVTGSAAKRPVVKYLEGVPVVLDVNKQPEEKRVLQTPSSCMPASLLCTSRCNLSGALSEI